ncbi:TIR domain-containing protein [Kordiimonas lipolytica]
MPVFISYRHNDLEKAFAISRRLQNEGITVYLDKLDQES